MWGVWSWYSIPTTSKRAELTEKSQRFLYASEKWGHRTTAPKIGVTGRYKESECLTIHRQGSPQSCVRSESISDICSCFSYSQDLWVQKSGSGNRNDTIITLCSAGLEPQGDSAVIPLNFKLRLLVASMDSSCHRIT